MARLIRLALALVLAGCATHDVLHAEALVRRGVCTGKGIGVFGLPDDESCGVQVGSLGDGCYVALRDRDDDPHPRQRLRDGRTWNPLLYECAANGPASHVTCVQDPLGPRARSFDFDDPVVWGHRVWLDGEGAAVTSSQRCEPRFEAWEDAHSPPLGPATVSLRDHDETFAVMTLREDALAVARFYHQYLDATVCPAARGGVTVTLRGDYPEPFAGEMRTLVARISRSVTVCRQGWYFLSLLGER